MRESTETIQLIGRERALGEDFGNLLFGANVLDVHARVRSDSFPQQVEIDSVNSGHMPLSRRSTLDTLLDDSVVVFKNDAFSQS